MWRIILAALLILTFSTGTSFFTLPFTVSLAGFLPAVLSVIICWAFLLLTGFYYLEATITLPMGANVYSISRVYSNPKLRFLNVFAFISCNYGYLIIFFSFCVPILNQILIAHNIPLSPMLTTTLFVMVLGFIVWLGLNVTMHINFLLVCVMSYIFYQFLHSKTISISDEKLSKFAFGYLFVIIPSLLDSIYFQTLIPSLAHFLKNDLKKIRVAIVTGFSLACILFIFWLWIVINSAAHSSFGEINWMAPDTITFTTLRKVPWIGEWLPYLMATILAATTLGAGCIFVDFFTDLFGLPLKERYGLKRGYLILLVYVPSLIAVLIPNQLILKIMLYVTSIGGLYLNAFMPINWIWNLRYRLFVKMDPLVPAGKTLIVILTALACFILYLVGLEFVYNSISYQSGY